MQYLIFICVLGLSSCGMRFGHPTHIRPAIDSNIRIAAEANDKTPPIRQAGLDRKIAERNDKHNTQSRLVISLAKISLEVASLNEAGKKIESITNTHQGYIEYQNKYRLSLRVPAASFGKVIEEIEATGVVTSKYIERTDVTDKIRDDNVRLQNLLGMQKRLLALVEKSNSIKDTLTIEKELNRITEQIELIKAVLHKAENKVRMGTINLELRAYRKITHSHFTTPFAWVERIGMSIGQPINQRHSKSDRWIRYDKPQGFVAWHEQKGTTKLISADDTHIHITRYHNVDEGDPNFWSELVSKHLKRNGIELNSQKTTAAYRKHVAHITQGSKKVGSTTVQCSIAIMCTKRYVYAIESWGPTQSFLEKTEVIEELYTNLRIQ